MSPEQTERRRHRRFSVDRKSLGGLPGGKVFTFRLDNVSYGGAYLRFCDGKSDLWQCASCGIHIDEVVELAFTMMIGRQLLPERLLCRVLEVSMDGIRLQFITDPKAGGLGALHALCEQAERKESSLPASDDEGEQTTVRPKGLAMYLID